MDVAAEKGVQDAPDGRGPLDGQEEGAAHKHEEPAACGTLWPPLGARLGGGAADLPPGAPAQWETGS